jgi:mRNA-degrading endonuclease RelE of RelBE toxin-antitoxin system
MKSNLTKSFRKSLEKLHPEVRQQARKAYQLWQQDPYHNSLQFKRVSQKQPIYSVRISLNYRALGLMDRENQIYWFWIGPHDEYDELLKRL